MKMTNDKNRGGVWPRAAAGMAPPHPCGGFSMIELLVASTLLIIVVMMLGMLFQQTSQAWRTGKQRVNAFKDARTMLGALQRDASAAVDKDTIPKELLALFGDQPQQLSSPTLAFYTLTGTGFKGIETVDNVSVGYPWRALTHITYSGGRRIEQGMTGGGGGAEGRSDRPLTKGKGFDEVRAHKVGPNGSVRDAANNEFPSFIRVRLNVSYDPATRYDIGAASSGPDRVFGRGPDDPRGRDDIKTWVEK